MGNVMPIANENRASSEILKDARYHRAALSASSDTAVLVAELESRERALREQHVATEAADDARLVAHARLARADLVLDDRLRQLELLLLAHVAKDRDAPAYRAAFPSGFTAFIALRGEAQARLVTSLVAALRAHVPTIAAEHAEPLEALAKAAVEAERAYQDAERRVASTFVEERLARVALIRQMQVNEGVLRAMFPGAREAVRTFFRPVKRRHVEEDAPDAS
jgi:hypothetical protein